MSSKDGELREIGEIKVHDEFKVIGDLYLHTGKKGKFLDYEGSEEFPSVQLKKGTLLRVIKLRKVRTSVESLYYVTSYYLTVEITSGELKGEIADGNYIFETDTDFKANDKHLIKIN